MYPENTTNINLVKYKNKYITSWCFQPIWKYARQFGSRNPKDRGEHQKMFEITTKKMYTRRNLTARPWKMMGKEDEFPFGIA